MVCSSKGRRQRPGSVEAGLVERNGEPRPETGWPSLGLFHFLVGGQFPDEIAEWLVHLGE
jgi:hypothetical protein